MREAGCENLQLSWNWYEFSELSGRDMHDVLSLRQEIFVVEQQCIYQDADELDMCSSHLLGKAEEQLVVYLRVTHPGSKKKCPTIGRVCVAKKFRGEGRAGSAVQKAMVFCRETLASSVIEVSAQHYLLNFYAHFGFTVLGKPYYEDGIKHIDMRMEFNS